MVPVIFFCFLGFFGFLGGGKNKLRINFVAEATCFHKLRY